MGQGEVYEFLKKHPGKKFTNKQISEELGVNVGNVTTSVRRLCRSLFNDVHRELDGQTYLIWLGNEN